ncbi:MAG: SemiSWEET transporter [Flavobacteriaceae bacterium]|nr:SemiSWEET transporter [Flavobacteriaceae bacterium]
MSLNIEIVGVIAAILTTSAFVPQVYKTWKSKSAKELSLTMYLVLFTGILLWFIYGYVIESFAIKLANIITGLLVLILIYFKLKYKK